MLFFGKNNSTKNSNGKGKEKPKEDYLSFLDIKVIPDKFNLNKIGGEVSSNKKSKKWIIIVIILIILLVISVLAVIGQYVDLSDKTNTSIISNEQEQNINIQPEEYKNEFAPDDNLSEEKENLAKSNNVNNVNSENKNENSSVANEKEFIEEENNNNNPVYNIISIGQDSDRDGLTDVEEKIFGSQSKKPDTDGDSYLDGSEVINLYSPLKANVKLIEEKELVKVYFNDKYGYELIYPQIWSLTENLTKDQVLISVPSQSERFSLYVKDNLGNLTAESYYIDNYQSSLGNYEVFNINGFSGIKSVNNQLIVLNYQNNLFIFEYSVGESKTLEFYSIFMMILKSFSVKQ